MTAPLPERSVRDFGVRGDGALETAAIQAAIDACADAGATLVLPAGTWRSGALFLKSRSSLRLEKGATLLGSGDPADYPPFTYRYEGCEHLNHASLLNTPPGRDPLHDIRICGEGTIDANGAELFRPEEIGGVARRGSAVCLRHVSGLVLEGVTIREAAFWCVHLVFCDHVSIRGVTVVNRTDKDGEFYGLHNGDGIDIDSCRDVEVLGCRIESQDDCVSIKSGRGEDGRRDGVPSERVLIADCEFRYGFGVSIGSECAAGVFDVRVERCVFRDSFSIASLKNGRHRGGGHIERVVYEDCSLVNEYPCIREMCWFRGALYIDQFYGLETFDPAASEPVDPTTPYIGKVTFRNISVRSLYGKAIYICGLPERHIDGVVLENVVADGLSGMVARNVDGLEMRGVSVGCL
ncbi:MAG: glycoside hydrolase family 28 protein [Kiritimatiellae bacterium]|nr:glycoside hydrolase family 28 protein [Kiritimatiellia bacterium]